MKKLLPEQIVYESILIMYFSKVRDRVLSKEIISLLDRFMAYCQYEDDFNKTFKVSLIKRVYSDNEFNDREDLLKIIGLSESALFRFRINTIKRLKKHLNDNGICKDESTPILFKEVNDCF